MYPSHLSPKLSLIQSGFDKKQQREPLASTARKGSMDKLQELQAEKASISYVEGEH